MTMGNFNNGYRYENKNDCSYKNGSGNEPDETESIGNGPDDSKNNYENYEDIYEDIYEDGYCGQHENDIEEDNGEDNSSNFLQDLIPEKEHVTRNYHPYINGTSR